MAPARCSRATSCWCGVEPAGSARSRSLVALAGGRPVAVVSSEKAEYCRRLGAVGTVSRTDFSHWGVPPAWDSPDWKTWLDGAKGFGKAIWDAVGESQPRIVFEHPGQDTIPTSNFVCDRGGMIVIARARRATTR